MKRTALRKKGNSKVSVLKRKLWEVFASFVKNRDNYTCFTCGRVAIGSGMHCGHFIPKSVGGLSLYFHEDNCHAQCYNCNINLGGNQYVYGQKLGEEKVKELYALKQKSVKWNDEYYEMKIQYYSI